MTSSLAPKTRGLRRLTALATAGAIVTLVALPGASSGQSAAPQTVVKPLSNERTLSRWAYPTSKAQVYARMSGSSRVVTRLRLLTEDKLPELYLLLAQATDSHGNQWVKIRVPKRPNGTTGWVRRSNLGDFHRVTTQLVINRRTLRTTLYRSGRVVFSAPIGVGKAGTVTPAGKFWVREKFRVRGTPVYGPYAIGTAAYSPTLTDWPNGGVVGLHGTNQPSLIPGRPSHGCVRLRNAHITRLYRMLPLGTPVRIL
jgi:lipoprotein-anchoring transpeptidase ErfK/SrfK